MKNKRRLILLKRLLPIVILIICILLSVGYTTVNYITLDIGGEIIAMEQEGVFVVDIKYKEGSGIHYANSEISVLKGTSLKHEIALSSTSSSSYITYIITVINNNDYDCQFNAAIYDDEFYDNFDIVYDLNNSIVKGDLIKSGETLEFEVTFKYKAGVSASDNNNFLNAYINYEFIPLAILKSYSQMSTTAFRTSTYTNKIKNVAIQDFINIPVAAVESWDIGVSQTGDVMAFVVLNESDPSYYDLYIQSDTQLYANKDMSLWFTGMKYVDTLTGLENLDTSNTTNMSAMFRETGYYSPTFTIDVSSFDTSKVTRMDYMFHQTGCQSLNFALDLSNFVTNNVTTMLGMFRYAGHASPIFSLNVTGWNTSNVTVMSGMFYGMGVSSQSLHLDLRSFNTSKVTNMDEMFYLMAKSSPDVSLDISSFDTSAVQTMKNMFNGLGYSDLDFVLDVSGLDTSNVTNMSGMFNDTGYKSTVFSLDVSGFDTNKVTDMSSMFRNSGYASLDYTLDVSNWDTSKVTDMSYMFCDAGRADLDFTLDVSRFDVGKVTSLEHMFHDAGYKSKIFTLDVANWNTENVTNMSHLFAYSGFYSNEFDLDLDNWNTSKVKDTSYMFYLAGWASSKLNVVISITNPNTLSYNGMFATVATNEGTQILVKYTLETSDLVDLMIATKGSGGHVYKWYDVGEVITIAGERFNIINTEGKYITMLAQNNLGTNYRQNAAANYMLFSNVNGWAYTPGPKEIDIQNFDGGVKTYVNEYVTYLQGVTGDSELSGNLITLKELKSLGCVIGDDYAFESATYSCSSSPYYSWLKNGQWWWTSSVVTGTDDDIWRMNPNAVPSLGTYNDSSACGNVRPVITISKDKLADFN